MPLRRLVPARDEHAACGQPGVDVHALGALDGSVGPRRRLIVIERGHTGIVLISR